MSARPTVARFAVEGPRWANLKTCNRCGEELPVEKFDKGRGVCRPCRYTGTRREKAIQRERDFRANNPEVIAQRNADYYARKAAEIAAQQRENAHVRWAAEYRRRIKRMRITGGALEEFTRADVIDAYGDACCYCGGTFEELDHVIPVSKNGPHTLANVRPSCGPCNRSKGVKVLEP